MKNLYGFLYHGLTQVSLLVFFFFSQSALSSEQSFLYQTYINKIVEDKKGYLWSGSQSGLKRFDGSDIVEYSFSSQNQIPFHWVLDIYVDHDRFILTTQRSGIWEFDPLTAEHRQIASDEANRLRNIRPFNHQFVAFGSEGLVFFDRNGIRQRIQFDHIVDLDVFRDDIYVLQREGGPQTPAKVYRWTGESMQELPISGISQIISTPDYLAIQGFGKLFLYQSEVEIQEVNHDVSQQLIGVSGDKQALLFFDNKVGDLYQFSKKDGFQRILETGLKHQSIKRIFQHRNGRIWLMSSQRAFHTKTPRFEHDPIHFGVTHNEIELAAHQGSLYMGSYGKGLFRYNDGTPEPVAIFHDQIDSYRANRIVKMHSDGALLWLATLDGLYSLDFSQGKLNRYLSELPSQMFHNVSVVDDEIFVCGDGSGFFILDRETLKVKVRLTDDSGLPTLEVLDALKVNEDTIWLSTTKKGIYAYDRVSQTVAEIPAEIDYMVLDLLAYGGKVYAASFGHGVYVLDHQGHLINHFYAGNDVLGFQKIDQSIWVGSRQGIYFIEPSSDQAYLFPGSRPFALSNAPMKHGEHIYAAGFFGMLKLKDYSFQEAAKTPVHISEAFVDTKRTINPVRLTLSHEAHNVSLKLVSLDYRHEQKQFRYRMDDGLWQPVYGQYLHLSHLPSGHHTIEVAGTNGVGQWSEQHAFLTIHVSPPWYWNFWSQLFYLSTLLMISAYVIRVLYVRSKAIHQIHKLLTEELLQGSEQKKQLKQALEQLREYAYSDTCSPMMQVCDQALRVLEHEIQSEPPSMMENQSLTEALPIMVDYLSQNFYIQTSLKIQLEQVTLPLSLQRDLYRMIYEILTNAATFSNGAKFELIIRVFNHKLWLMVHDEGMGLMKINNHATYNIGLFVLRQLASQYQARFEVITRKSKGSTATMTIALDEFVSQSKDFEINP
ncbi:sensor histidine kinase [Algicola sagamiensis]|uniref:sensor histidine kinase n=1 Tax=Algicola sagamiensis TaxID=163869 RepID=UPI00037DB372|nr:sensor histidine kinase [Algicola sagamiensis]